MRHCGLPLSQLFEIKQGRDQKLSDYFETTKALSHQVHKYFDDLFLDKFVMSLEEYDIKDETGQATLKDGAW